MCRRKASAGQRVPEWGWAAAATAAAACYLRCSEQGRALLLTHATPAAGEDLWQAFNLIREGDRVEATTFRKVGARVPALVPRWLLPAACPCPHARLMHIDSRQRPRAPADPTCSGAWPCLPGRLTASRPSCRRRCPALAACSVQVDRDRGTGSESERVKLRLMIAVEAVDYDAEGVWREGRCVRKE